MKGVDLLVQKLSVWAARRTIDSFRLLRRFKVHVGHRVEAKHSSM